MPLIIALGSNLQDKMQNILDSHLELNKHFKITSMSRIYKSEPENGDDQPSYYNQVIECLLPSISPKQVLTILERIEIKMGRVEKNNRRPRIIDLDILFWGLETFNFENLTIPHPRWHLRSFVVYPLMDLPFYSTLRNHFEFPITFEDIARPI